MELKKDFVFRPLQTIQPGLRTALPAQELNKPSLIQGPHIPTEGRLPPLQSPFRISLGPLQLLPGTWTGTGFNQIWRDFYLNLLQPP